MEYAKTRGVGAADIEFDCSGQRIKPPVALDHLFFNDPGYRDEDARLAPGQGAQSPFDRLRAGSRESHRVDERTLVGHAKQARPRVPRPGSQCHGSADRESETHVQQATEAQAVFVHARGDARGIRQGYARHASLKPGIPHAEQQVRRGPDRPGAKRQSRDGVGLFRRKPEEQRTEDAAVEDLFLPGRGPSRPGAGTGTHHTTRIRYSHAALGSSPSRKPVSGAQAAGTGRWTFNSNAVIHNAPKATRCCSFGIAPIRPRWP